MGHQQTEVFVYSASRIRAYSALTYSCEQIIGYFRESQAGDSPIDGSLFVFSLGWHLNVISAKRPPDFGGRTSSKEAPRVCRGRAQPGSMQHPALFFIISAVRHVAYLIIHTSGSGCGCGCGCVGVGGGEGVVVGARKTNLLANF